MLWDKRASQRPSLVILSHYSALGFQTHTSPVLFAAGERAELATEEYLALQPVLENIVILATNPEFIERKK